LAIDNDVFVDYLLEIPVYFVLLDFIVGHFPVDLRELFQNLVIGFEMVEVVQSIHSGLMWSRKM